MGRLSWSAVIVAALAVALPPSHAEVENRVFTSSQDRLRLVVPRGWRESDAASYPGLLLWMIGPNAKMVLTAEPFTRQLYCSWPIKCRTSHEVDTVSGKFACALAQQLTSQHMKVSPVQAGPKENEEAGLTSVWFEYDDGHHFLRQAVAVADDRAISLVLSAASADARAAGIRAFESALRTLRTVSPAELAASASTASANAANSAPVKAPSSTSDVLPSAIGPCTQRQPH